MSEDSAPGPERRRSQVPRDLPDQEAATEVDGQDAEPEGADEELPDTDEAGSGPRGAGRHTTGGTGAGPEPEEPTD